MRAQRWLAAVAVAVMGVIGGATAASPDAGVISAASLVRPGDVVLGNPNGSITIVDFYDTSCAPCRAMNRRIERLIARNKQIRYVPIDVPILGWQSKLGAQALVAARLQGRFDAMHTLLMSQAPLPTLALLKADAAQLGMDVPRFMRDMTRPATIRAVDASLQRGAALGIDEVPMVYVGQSRIPGAMGYRDLRWLVRQAQTPEMSQVATTKDHS
ncbi:MAG: thioredoxin domain-containing protein [Proteobacteria bacterium]|nr:thioredoxin domain-containing protein [Pseudomonadota bacterium]